MIARVHRFHGHNSLNFAYQHGKSIANDQLGLKAVLNHKRSTYRAAVVVSKKVSKSAVVRNRLRRKVYEAIRCHEPSLSQPYDLIFTVFDTGLTNLSQVELEKTINQLLQRAGIH